MLSFFFIKTTSYASPSPINLTLVDKRIAVPKSAFCLNCSLPGYYFDKGFEDGVSNWLVNLQDEAWCNITEDCLNRAKYSYGSTSNKKTMNFTGILDKEEINNPHFYNWNRVYVRYCDGASFMGDVQEVDPVKTAFLQAIDEIGFSPTRGILIHSCYLHCHTEFGNIWEKFRTLKNLTLAKVIGDWFSYDGNFFIKIDTSPAPRYCKNI